MAIQSMKAKSGVNAMIISKEIFKDLKVYDTGEILALINESLKEINNRSLPYILLLESYDRKNTAEEIFNRVPKKSNDLEYGSTMGHDF